MIENIYLVRHGQSLANISKEVHATTPDHAIALSDLGKHQATLAGQALAELIDPFIGNVRMWVSPYLRTRQTANQIKNQLDLDSNRTIDVKEDIALCEQQFGLFDGIEDIDLPTRFPVEHAHYALAEKHEGKFWPRMPMGESRFDVAMRIRSTFATFRENAETENVKNLIVVTHGVAMRAFVMGWRNKPYEWFESEKNPGNCDIYRLCRNPKDDGYVHKTTLLQFPER